MTERIRQAEDLLKKDEAACVIITKELVPLESRKNGIAPLLEWLQESPDTLKGACAADKVVGKAAALLMVYGGINEVYAEIISESAEDLLKQNRIQYEYGQKVSYIQNRTKTGMCPMEQRCLDINSPEEAYTALSKMAAAHSMMQPK